MHLNCRSRYSDTKLNGAFILIHHLVNTLVKIVYLE